MRNKEEENEKNIPQYMQARIFMFSSLPNPRAKNSAWHTAGGSVNIC